MIRLPGPPTTRRQLLTRIGIAAGSAAMYQAMTRLGHAAGTDFSGGPQLTPPPGPTTVLVLGAGLAGMLAAFELRRAGYQVRILEYAGFVFGRESHEIAQCIDARKLEVLIVRPREVRSQLASFEILLDAAINLKQLVLYIEYGASTNPLSGASCCDAHVYEVQRRIVQPINLCCHSARVRN